LLAFRRMPPVADVAGAAVLVAGVASGREPRIVGAPVVATAVAPFDLGRGGG
jgi:hypothetical protein